MLRISFSTRVRPNLTVIKIFEEVLYSQEQGHSSLYDVVIGKEPLSVTCDKTIS